MPSGLGAIEGKMVVLTDSQSCSAAYLNQTKSRPSRIVPSGLHELVYLPGHSGWSRWKALSQAHDLRGMDPFQRIPSVDDKVGMIDESDKINSRVIRHNDDAVGLGSTLIQI
jgi:hypothetical protein